MGNFRSNSRGGFGNRSGGNRFGGRPGGFSGRDRDSRPERRNREMHNVTCSRCGRECQVPFKPTGDKPVFCNDCFKREEGSDRFQSGASPEQLSQINAKLDKILAVLRELEIDVGETEEDFDEDLEDEDLDEDSDDDSEDDEEEEEEPEIA